MWIDLDKQGKEIEGLTQKPYETLAFGAAILGLVVLFILRAMIL